MKKEYIWISLFLLAIILLATFSTITRFHDTPEYITIAKNFAGIKNVDLFLTHSLLYPLFLSPFIKLFPSEIMIKIINSIWIFLIGLVLLYFLKNKKAFIIFAFSPLVWYLSIQTTPILPASFFLLLSYIFLKKEELKHYLKYSGIFLGIACAFYDPIIILAILWIIIFFYNKKSSELFEYMLFILIGLSPRLILDFYLFNNPLYSLIRFIGANVIVSLGLHPTTKNVFIFSNFKVFLIVILISPFLFKLYKLSFQEYKKEILFLSFTSFIFLIRLASIKYFFIILPIVILLLCNVLNDKEIKLHIILSIVLILIIIFAFFIPNSPERIIKNDLNKITQDYHPDYIVAGGYNAGFFASLMWDNSPSFIWFSDYNASINNKTKIRDYKFVLTSDKIRLRENVQILGTFVRFDNLSYNNYIIVEEKDKNLTGFKVGKCYERLCVYDNK